MTAGLVARLAIAVCLLAAAVETVLGCISTASLAPSDGLIVLFIIGPYLLLALLAWRQRGRPAASWTLLAVAVVMSAWGLYVLGEDSYRYHTEPQYGKYQRLAGCFVPLVQWAIVLLVGLGLLVWRLASPRSINRDGSWGGLPPETAEELKARFLAAGGECIDRFNPKADYKEKRSAGILATFDWLLGLSRHHHWRKTKSEGQEAEQNPEANGPHG
jgi:hypothetical protein